MNAITTHLDDLLLVLRASADFRPSDDTAAHLRAQVATQLDADRPDLAARIRTMDEWHCEVLADFLTEAHVMAEALDGPTPEPPATGDTRVG